jgi:hypothetical protein
MQRSKIIILCTIAILFVSACNNHQPEPTKQPSIVENKTEGTFCFLSALNKDSTMISLTITGNKVNGTMHWQPYEKDGSVGTLMGTKNANGEMDLLYDYIIEGNRQTETKVMKIENGKLMIKNGELVDANNNGNLKYKDVTKANYTETLDSVSCKN